MRRILRISLLGVLGLALLTPAFAQVVISVGFAPPALPVYEQPACPTDGWLWIPGFWAWDADYGDYYWVPGTWVPAPEPGYLWTPPWWGWANGAFIFHDGFWGPEIGFYGGVNYGFGYFGHGFYGGRWDHDHFYYNRAVMNVNETVVRNVYVDQTVINNTTIINNHVSYNGGQGGITDRPRPEEERAAQDRHFEATQAQLQRRETARSNPQMRASANQGRPPIAATARADDFSRGAVAAKSAGAPYYPPANRVATPRATPEPVNPNEGLNASHARDLQPHQVGPPPNTGDPRLDQKYQQQQQRLVDRQNQEHEKLQAQQDREDQQMQGRQAGPQEQQQMEQRHQQQTQQMVQRHTQQTQQLQQRQAPRQERPPR